MKGLNLLLKNKYGSEESSGKGADQDTKTSATDRVSIPIEKIVSQIPKGEMGPKTLGAILGNLKFND